MRKSECPGLKYRLRKDGRRVAIWCAPPQAVKAGFIPKTLSLDGCAQEDVRDRCRRLWNEALAYAGGHVDRLSFDGTLGSVLRIYELHSDSPFRRVKASTQREYSIYLNKLSLAYGKRRVAGLTGLDILRWSADWRECSGVAAASFILNVLRAALSFGQTCGLPGCAALREMIRTLRLPLPRPREEAPGLAEVRAAMDAARRLGYPSAAFAYALQFETAIRQYDVIGQWVPMDDERPSSVLAGGTKWIGPLWSSIDENMVLTIVPSKTEKTSRARVRIDLKLCGLVQECLTDLPIEERTGPLILNDKTKRPFTHLVFQGLWRRVRKEAGLRPTLWNRDLCAGSLTEASMAGATSDDRAKLAAHSKKMTQQVYDRDVLVSANRVAAARAKFREKKD